MHTNGSLCMCAALAGPGHGAAEAPAADRRLCVSSSESVIFTIDIGTGELRKFRGHPAPWLGGLDERDVALDVEGVAPCPADITGPTGVPDGIVDFRDLLPVLSAWGPC